MNPPIRFAFGLHLHQPVGNFDSVFEQHLAEVYGPLLEQVIGGGCAPVTLHLSGPLLDWLVAHAPEFLDRLGRQVADGRIELLCSGYDEPILAVLSRNDRLEQIGRMREALQARFGVKATGLWLTERVWEPDLAGDLCDAGVRYALVDDRHFLVAGFERNALHRPWRTEHGGRPLDLFPIDEQLRYLVPFRPPEELADHLRRLRAAGHQLAILADDGEKFGGWPGTREWVYDQGWLKGFLGVLDALRESGELRLVTLSQALSEVPSGGLAYLPSASYREMEGWALPPDAARRLADLEANLGEERMRGPEGMLIRGSHWRNFLAKYPESNRMHKKMQALSDLSRAAGDPPAARRAIGRAQCNDAYWHGVFGGLYLPHLREAIWRELARAEAELRRGQSLHWESRDLDQDGATELWLHSSSCSVVLSPARGGGIEEMTSLTGLVNCAATLTRRREAYHLEHSLVLGQLPPVDSEPRAIFQERIRHGAITLEELRSGDSEPIHSWAMAAAEWSMGGSAQQIEIDFRLTGLEKRMAVGRDGSVEVSFTWTPDEAWPADAWFTTELSLFRELQIVAPGAVIWRYSIETVSKSERGFDHTVQGESITLAWPVSSGAALVTLAFPP